MFQVELLEQHITELDDFSFTKLHDWFVAFDQTRCGKKLEIDFHSGADSADLAQINAHAQELNAEAKDALSYQVFL